MEEIWKKPVWGFSNIWRQEWVIETKFNINVYIENLVNAAECQFYSL